MVVLTNNRISDVIDRATQQYRLRLRTSPLGHQRAFEELREVWEECRRPGWDGYEALPVEQATLTAAYTLIDSLPIGFPRPTISAEPDGQITLEWRTTPSRLLSVSVDPDGYLHYAGVFGPNRRYGRLVFFSTAPDELLQLVREL